MKPTTTRKTARRGGKADKSEDPKYLAKLVKDGHAIDLEDAKHVAKLIAKGMLRLGEPGPIPPDLLRPGPKISGVQAALRADRRSR